MSDSSLIDRPIVLRSPFNGEAWTVPPELPDALVQELLTRGFTRVDPQKKATPKGPSHGSR